MSEDTPNAMTAAPQQPNKETGFEKLGRYKYLLNTSFGVVAAFFCCICVLYLSLFIAMPTMLPLVIFNWTMIFTPGMASAGNSPLFLVLAILLSGSFFYSGMASGRFFLRAIPPRLSGKRRQGVLLLLMLVTVWSLITLYLNIFGKNDTPVAPPENLNLPPSFLSEAATVDTSLFMNVFQFSVTVFFLLGCILPLFIRHWNPRYFLEKPFVLFLRRFSRFPDRTVQHTLLKSAPAGKPLAFLTPTGSRSGDWDPFRVGFSGLKFRRPIRSMPVILRSTNEDWRPAARELIDHAQTIVMDLSEGSGAIQTEIDMIEAANRWPDVVILSEKGKVDDSEAEEVAGYVARGAILIDYQKSWRRAAPRLFTGLFVTFLVIVPLFFLIPLGVRMFMHFDFGAGFTQPAPPPMSIFSFSSTYVFLVNIVLYWYIYRIFFFRPALNRSAIQVLRNRLRR